MTSPTNRRRDPVGEACGEPRAFSSLSGFARAKINLFLDVTGRRPDGYHELSMLLHRIDLADRVQVGIDPDQPGIRLTCRPAGVPEDRLNTAWKAAELFLAAYHLEDHCGVDISIDKRIPAGAGLGGGSADAAFVLQALQTLLRMPDDGRLAGLALRVGADVPFLVGGECAWCGGVGEIIEALPPWPELPILLAWPRARLLTGDVFSTYDRVETSAAALDAGAARKAWLTGDLDAFAAAAGNTLTFAAAALQPGIRRLLDALRAGGAVYAAMSGSGSSCFGLYRNHAEKTQAAARLTAELPEIEILPAGLWASGASTDSQKESL